jgi:hypothetical protein
MVRQQFLQLLVEVKVTGNADVNGAPTVFTVTSGSERKTDFIVFSTESQVLGGISDDAKQHPTKTFRQQERVNPNQNNCTTNTHIEPKLPVVETESSVAFLVRFDKAQKYSENFKLCGFRNKM